MRRHPFDPVSAVFGLVFVLAGMAAVLDVDGWSLVTGGRLWALALLLGGIAVLAATLRSRPAEQVADPMPEPVEEVPLTDAELAIEELRREHRATREQRVNLEDGSSDENV